MPDAIPHQSVADGKKRSGIKRFAIRFCVGTTITVALLIAGECLAYYHLPRGNGQVFNYKSYVLWQATPRVAGQSLEEDGLRRTLSSHCEDDDFTIWLFGSSSMWGYYLRDEDTIPSLLAKAYEQSGRRVCVRNYGQPAWVSTQELIELMLELKHVKKKPDVVIFYDGSLDSILPSQSDEPDAHLGFPTFKRKFETWKTREASGFDYILNTNTYVALRRYARGLNLVTGDFSRAIPQERFVAQGKLTYSNYLKNMEMLDMLAARYGFQYVCLWEPWLPEADKPLSASENLMRNGTDEDTIGEMGVLHATYKIFRDSRQPHLIYLGDVFKNHPETLFQTLVHLHPGGNLLVAQRIYQILQDMDHKPASAVSANYH